LPQAVDPLIEMMKNDDSYQARILAAMALYEQGDAKGFQAIKEQADKDPRQSVRTNPARPLPKDRSKCAS
jgi:HEAT repeat protein